MSGGEHRNPPRLGEVFAMRLCSWVHRRVALSGAAVMSVQVRYGSYGPKPAV